MATRWQNFRDKYLVDLAKKDVIDSTDIPTLEIITSQVFNCARCEYRGERAFKCDKSVDCCRKGFANYLNQEVEEDEQNGR